MTGPEPREPMTDSAHEIRRIRDELDIVRLLATLARAQDDRDRDAYLSCFTETVNLTRSAVLGESRQGRIAAAELADLYFAEMDRYSAGQHMVSNHIIDVRGDDASCSADLHAIALSTDTGPIRVTFVAARYDLKLCRSDGRWLIYQRSVTTRLQGSYLVEGAAS